MTNDPDPAGERHSVRGHLRRAFLTGTALTIPLVLTLVVLQIALDLVAHVVSPVVSGVELVFGPDEAPQIFLEAVTALTLVGLVLLIGLVAEHRSGSSWFSEGFDALMAQIPGLGSVYTGTRRMSEMLLEPDVQSFQEVKLVEFPKEGAFMLGFLTAEPPETIHESAGAGAMQTLFVPLAPNPVMGGFLVHFPEERIADVDLTVEEGIQSIVTSGAAIDQRIDGDGGSGPGDIGDVQFLDGDLFDWDGFGEGVLPEEDVLPGEGVLPGEDVLTGEEEDDEVGKPG